jgi:Ni/Co efflux regulator RcnB
MSMKSSVFAVMLLGASLLFSSMSALADRDHYHSRDRWDSNDQRDWRSDSRAGWNKNDRQGWKDNVRWRGQDDNRRWHGNGWHGRKDGWNERVVVIQRDYVRGVPRPYYEWRSGQYLPVVYRQRNYYVDDWRSYRLYEPPRGYRWVNVNGDYILVSVVSNVIAHILLGH